MASRLMFIAICMVLVSLAMSEDKSAPKRASIEDIAAKAAVAYVQKLFGLEHEGM